MRDVCHFFFGRSYLRESLSWGFHLMLGGDMRIGEPGEIILAKLHMECWIVPWREIITQRRGWFWWQRFPHRKWTLYRVAWRVRSDWDEIKRRRRAMFGDAFA